MKALAGVLLLIILVACGSTAQAHARPFWDGPQARVIAAQLALEAGLRY